MPEYPPIWEIAPQIAQYLQGQRGIELGDKIGEGGTADVAEGVLLNVKRAVKICREQVKDGSAVDDERRRLEAYISYGVDHPAIVRLNGYECASIGDGSYESKYLYTVWELGTKGLDSLACNISRQQLLAYLKDVAGALDYLHARGFVHRDVKPQNIFLFDEPPKARLGDLGFVKLVGLSSAGTRIYSLGFAAPEMLLDAEAYPATDLYSLAASYVWMRAGKNATGNWPLASR